MIVTKRREHFVQMLQEEGQRRGLNIPIQDKRFSVLFTPVGRFLPRSINVMWMVVLFGKSEFLDRLFCPIHRSRGFGYVVYLDRFLLRYCENCRTYKDWNRTLSTVFEIDQGSVQAGDIEVSLNTLQQCLTS